MHIPPVLVLIVCKVAIAGAPDQNADMTGAQNLEWATENSMMTCRRNEVQLYDPAEGQQLSAADDPAPPGVRARPLEGAREASGGWAINCSCGP